MLLYKWFINNVLFLRFSGLQRGAATLLEGAVDLLHLRKTTAANATVVELHVIHPVAVNGSDSVRRRSRHIEQVDYSATLFTKEVDVRTQVTVVAHTVIVDGQHLRRLMFGEQT